ncbi:MAG: pseudoazurin [Pseudomonadota bacterium]
MRFFKVAMTIVPFILGTAALAADHEVQMLNKGPDGQTMWYDPAILVAEPGDTITFLPTKKGHNSESMLVPEGAEEWKSRMNKEITITVESEGVYAYKCTPHFGSGMIGFIVVGDPSINMEEVKGLRYAGKSKKVAEQLIAEIEASM